MVIKMRIGIIGAGAAGMIAAITAAKEGAEVTVFEKNERVGKKLLSTGNGKCNLGNMEFGTAYYYCREKEKLEKMFQHFSQWDTISFFESTGLMIREKNGYLYPYAEQASAVLDILRMEMEKNGVTVIAETDIVSAAYKEEDQIFVIRDRNGKKQCFDRLILSCGSPASLKKGDGKTGYELAKSFGHRIETVVPGLCGLRSDESFTKALAGVRTKAKVTLFVKGMEAAAETGEVQFTDYGISGIPVFQMSRIVSYAFRETKDVSVEVDFFPDQEEKAYAYMTKLRYEMKQEETLENFLIGTLNKKINMVMIKRSGCKPGTPVKEIGFSKVKELMEQYRSFKIHISGPGCLENAQVCAGGVDFSQVTEQMESCLRKGLYFAGEMVDVDGKCGGYNLQWAWTSGYLAGKNAAGAFGREKDGAEERKEC